MFVPACPLNPYPPVHTPNSSSVAYTPHPMIYSEAYLIFLEFTNQKKGASHTKAEIWGDLQQASPSLSASSFLSVGPLIVSLLLYILVMTLGFSNLQD